MRRLFCLVTVVIFSPLPNVLNAQAQKIETIESKLSAAIFALHRERIYYAPWGGSGQFRDLNDPSVRGELELLDHQYNEISQIKSETAKLIKEARKEAEGNPAISQPQLGMKIIGMQNRQKKAIEAVLLPHQHERLKQLRNQRQMQDMGTAGALSNSVFAKELGLTDDQKKELAELQKELEKEIQEKIKELKEDAKKRILKKLTPEQRSKLKQLTGDEFTRNSKAK